MNKRNTGKIPCSIATFSSDEDSNLLKVRLKVVKTGSNYNGSKFSLDNIKKAEPTLFNIPILGFLKATDEEGNYDYDGHNMITQIVEEPNGYKVTYKYLERPIGVIPESSKVDYVEEDGVTYMYCDGYIWKSYANEGLKVILDADSKSISMEIEVIDGTFDEDDWYYDITDFKYLGITVLGDDVNPAIEGACMTKSVDFSSYRDEIQRICNEIYSMEQKEGEGMSVVDNQQNFEEPVVDPVEPAEPAEPAQEPIEPAQEPVEPAEPVDEPVDEPVEPEEEPAEPAEPEDDKDEPVEEFSIFEEVLGKVSSKEELLEAIKTKIGEYAELIAEKTAEIESMKEKVAKFEQMEKEQHQAELDANIKEVLAKFTVKEELATPFIEKVKADEMSIDEFKKEMGYLYAEEQINNKSNFSREGEVKDPEVNVASQDDGFNPYGGLSRLIKK